MHLAAQAHLEAGQTSTALGVDATHVQSLYAPGLEFLHCTPKQQIVGAFLAALAIGEVKALCIGLGDIALGPLGIVSFPKLTLVAESLVMAVVLVLTIGEYR